MSSPLRARALAALAAALLGLAATAHAATRFEGLVLPFKEVVVSSPVQSSLTALPFKEGDVVKAGDTLARLHDRIEELDMLRAKAALEKKEFDNKSAANLFADKIISEDEALKNKIELDLARLQYEQAAELHRQRTVTAPIDGLIVERNREVGETVTASQPLFRLVDISRLYVQFYVRAEDASSLRVGQTLEVRSAIAAPGRVFTGKVDFIDPRVDAASGLLRVKVLLNNDDAALKPGLRAEITAPAAP
ncbi:MAG: efflux RND transporter periplasmic adaptor subunit [Opitutaceae bacterium]|nr:efflux RND transporter periplasmic adaptor subunit [Opitutaceae bacterium]